MTVTTAPAEPLRLTIDAAASAVARQHQGIRTAGWARRGVGVLEEGVLVVLLAYLLALAMVAVCLPFALLVALARWLGS